MLYSNSIIIVHTDSASVYDREVWFKVIPDANNGYIIILKDLKGSILCAIHEVYDWELGKGIYPTFPDSDVFGKKSVKRFDKVLYLNTSFYGSVVYSCVFGKLIFAAILKDFRENEELIGYWSFIYKLW